MIATKREKKITRIIIELKKEIQDKHENDVCVSDLATQFGMPKSTSLKWSQLVLSDGKEKKPQNDSYLIFLRKRDSLPNNNIFPRAFLHNLPLTPSTLLHTGMVKLN